MLTSDALSAFHNSTPSTGMDIALIFIRTLSLINWCVPHVEYNGIDFTYNCWRLFATTTSTNVKLKTLSQSVFHKVCFIPSSSFYSRGTPSWFMHGGLFWLPETHLITVNTGRHLAGSHCDFAGIYKNNPTNSLLVTITGRKYPTSG